MTDRLTPHAQLARPTQRIRDLLDLLAGLRTIDQPLTTPDGLRASLELLLRLAEFVGIESNWTDRLRQIIADPRVFELVLAVVRYLDGFVNPTSGNDVFSSGEADADQLSTIDAQAFIDWLPIVVQILSLLQKLRGVA